MIQDENLTMMIVSEISRIVTGTGFINVQYSPLRRLSFVKIGFKIM